MKYLLLSFFDIELPKATLYDLVMRKLFLVNVLGSIFFLHLAFAWTAPDSICNLTRTSDFCLDTNDNAICSQFVKNNQYDFSTLNQGGVNSKICEISFVYSPILSLIMIMFWLLFHLLYWPLKFNRKTQG